jgi:hypothetical protein
LLLWPYCWVGGLPSNGWRIQVELCL